VVLQKLVSAYQNTAESPYLGYGENDVSICVVLSIVSLLSPFPLRIAHAYLDLRERTLVSREKNRPHVCDVVCGGGVVCRLICGGQRLEIRVTLLHIDVQRAKWAAWR
jgi:hypothetical protein